VVGAGICGVIADARHNYRALLVACFAAGAAALGGLMVALPLRSAALVGLSLGGVGFAMMPVMPLSYELCAECTYPMSEVVPAGLLVSGGQVKIENKRSRAKPTPRGGVFEGRPPLGSSHGRRRDLLS